MSTTPRYLIVDDEPRLAERLAQRLAVAWPQAECLGLWHDGLSAREAIASGAARAKLDQFVQCTQRLAA